jgi:L-aspartate oxidase
MKAPTYDVLIVGCGIAGLSCAIKLAEKNLSVAIITRDKKPEDTNTLWAQGGIIYSKDDESLISDIETASAMTSNPLAAKILQADSPKILEELLFQKAKTSFDKDDKDGLLFTKEAAHSKARIIYKGDYTGKEIQISLLNFLNDKDKFPNVSFLTQHTAIDLITPNHHGVSIRQRYEPHQVVGAYVFDQDSGEVKKILAKKTVLATGGIGALYLHNSNNEGARGDGHAMAQRAGAFISNMEFIQFHPTTFFSENVNRRFLISEAVRGEGAILKNSLGERFMHNYHADAELAPRDIVSRAILAEMIRLKNDCVYLDISDKPKEWIEQRFPTIYKYCLDHKVDISKEAIPVVPAAHYTCGGVKTDLFGRTNLPHLYAVGEVANTGLHGANRLASTSLLEGLTFGYRAAEDIFSSIGFCEFYDETKIRDWRVGGEELDLGLISQDIQTIKQTMWNYLGLKRNKTRLARARAMFREMNEEIHKFYRHAQLHDDLIGLRNSIEVAHMVLDASVINKKSAGCFYRED